MLFDEVAICPDCIHEEGVMEALHHRFGWSQGRVVCTVPSDWKERVRQFANTLPDGLTKTRIKDLASRLAVVPPALTLSKQAAWREAVADLHQHHPLDGIIVREPLAQSGWYAPEQIDEYLEVSEERIGHYELSNQQPADIVRALAGFLRVNKRLVLVNAYQWFFQRRTTEALFRALMKAWAEQGGAQFRVIRSLRSDFQHWGDECRHLEAFLREIRYKGTFTFIAVEDEANRLHERYLIGSICGLELGYGLELNYKPQTWKLLRQSSYRKRKQEFIDQDIRDVYSRNETWHYPQR